MGEGWAVTGISELLEGRAEDFEGPAKLLGAEVGVEDEEDLDDFDWAVGGPVDGTHVDDSFLFVLLY